MIDPSFFQNKKITVVGLARSGASSARLLQRLGAQVSVTEKKDDPETEALARELAASVAVELGKHTESFIEARDLVVVSPGVPAQADPVAWAFKRGIPVISEIEVAWRLCSAPVVAVTGSNGKTTTTTLIGKVFEAAGRKAWVCGNIGTPFCSVVESIDASDVVVLEVSSFQLETIRTFKPWIAVILNLTKNHLDRYPGMREYAEAKMRICMNQDRNDHLVLNQDDPLLRSLRESARSDVVFFSSSGKYNPDQAAVAAVASLAGIPGQICDKVFADFRGLEHRMELVSRVNGVSFINDSKATTVESAVWALQNIPGPVVWIAGGRHKGVDYSIVRRIAQSKVKRAVLIGEARPLIRRALEGAVVCEEALSIQEAVAKAAAFSSSGDTVLLSPMCSSYDMFTDYEERGRAFKKAVQECAGIKT